MAQLIKRPARRRHGPLFVFVTSATLAGLLGHGALLASVNCPPRTEWKTSTSPELVRETDEERQRLALERVTLRSVNLLVLQP